MDVSRSKHTETFLRTKLLISLHSYQRLSANTLPVREAIAIVLPIFQSLAIRHLGLLTSGQAVPGIISENLKSRVSVWKSLGTFFEDIVFGDTRYLGMLKMSVTQ